MDKILVIGGHGMLGRPVVRHLVQDGFTVRALARDPNKAQGLLPGAVEVVQGDLEDVASLRRAAEGMEAVYLNLETPNHKSPFRPDLDGVRNVIVAIKEQPDVLIAKIAGLGLRHTDGWWPNSDLKFEAEALIKASGHPYLLFHPTWFMESLPLFIRGKQAMLFGRKWHPLYWIAGDDYAKMVGQAFRKNITNRTFNVQGLEPFDYDEALDRFIKLYAPEVKIVHIPLLILALLGIFVPVAHDFHRLFYMASKEKQEFQSQPTWDELHKPQMKIEDYYNYLKATGDIPKKG